MIARAKRIRSQAARDYRIACAEASRLERHAKRHSRIAGPKLLASERQPEILQPKTHYVIFLSGIRRVLGRIQLVRQ